MRLQLAIIFISALALATQIARAGDPDGFGIWRVSDLKAHEKVLDQKVGPDHSARETLGSYGSHMVRMIHRDADGAPEFHTNFVDLWVIESGSGTMVVGGTLIDEKAMGGADGASRGEKTGTGISGGERHEVAAGDVIHVPAATPHEILVPKGGEVTYLRIAIPNK